MSVNKLALIRYKTIDECLQNHYRQWTLEDLIDKVSDRLYEYEGISDGVSKRTIQGDIQLMRSDKLGYNAPIVVRDRKYYVYSDPDYSITNAPINSADVEKMKEVLGVLKQFSGFSYFDDMSSMIARLENNINTSTKQSKNYIQFEGNVKLRGFAHINPLYQAILNKQSLLITYQSFKAQAPIQQIYYPYLLKEYRNRWFLIARAKGGSTLLTMALDRILAFELAAHEPYKAYEGVDFDIYYSDLLGVTKSEKDRAHKVVLRFNKFNAPYVITKPLHASQQVLNEDESSIVIRIDVVLNFELEREILGFGEGVKVLEPRLLQSRIKRRLQLAAGIYSV